MKFKLIWMGIVVGMIAAATLLMSSSTDDPTLTQAATSCASHGITDSLCTRCHPELIAAFKARGDWCNEHNLPESQCDLCNPALRRSSSINIAPPHEAVETEAENRHAHSEDSTMDWCPEHRAPESECTKCHPDLAAKFKEKGDWCEGHDVPESHCYLCDPGLKFPQEALYEQQQEMHNEKQKDKPKTSLFRLNKSHCASDDAVIQLASIATAERAGLTVSPVSEQPAMEILDVPAEVEFDEDNAAIVTTLVGGTLLRWLVQPGQHIQKGQVLAQLESLDGASLKADYVHALSLLNLAKASLEREEGLSRNGMVSAKELQEAEADFLRAEADYRKAAAALRALGYTDAEMEAVAREDADPTLVTVRARRGGTLVERSVAAGSVLEAGQPIGLIAETGRLWVESYVRERDLSRVRTGQTATIIMDGLDRCNGQVVWVADGVDPETRLGKVRIAADRNGSALRAHQFVTAEIALTVTDDAMLIPADAVQWDGCCNVVFVADTPDRFRPRKVQVQFIRDNQYVVTGLRAGERIVTNGSYLLKTELMKSSIGAGCCGTGA